MKKWCVILFFGMLGLFAFSQRAGVEQSNYGIQIGLLGIWVHNEARLWETIALRSEIGFDSGLFGGSRYYDNNNIGYLMVPVITAEPRWYYNLNKRLQKSKRIDGNSGNFVSLKTSFHPDWFVISNYDNLRVVSDISIIPTWGIRRNIGNHFNYETGIGLGYRYTFAKNAGYAENEKDLGVNLHLRIGYRF